MPAGVWPMRRRVSPDATVRFVPIARSWREPHERSAPPMDEWLEGGRAEPDDPLTPRELEVVKLIAEAFTNRQIAETLTLSEKTVESHRANLLAKLGMRDRVELVRYAIRRGLGASRSQRRGRRHYAPRAMNPRVLIALVLLCVFALAATVLAATGKDDDAACRQRLRGRAHAGGACARPTSRCATRTARRSRCGRCAATGDRDVPLHALRGQLPGAGAGGQGRARRTSDEPVPALAVAVDPPNDTAAERAPLPRRAAGRGARLRARSQARS